MAKNILDILSSKSVIDLAEVSQIKKEAKEKKMTIEDVLYSHGVNEIDVAEAKSTVTGFPTKFLQGNQIPFDVLRDIPEESARHYKMIPLGRREGYIEIGMLSPEDVGSQEAIKFISARANLPAKIFVISPSDFQSVLSEYKSLSGEVTSALGEFQKEYQDSDGDIKFKTDEPTKIVDEAPVTKMVGVILRHAVEGRASDIHIEPERKKLQVRFRVDGVLHTSLLLPLDIHSAIVTRIKVVTNLKIDETRIPQDGRFRAQISGRDIDFRVSTFPTVMGEKVVLRILDPEAGVGDLPTLGLEGRNLVAIQENLRRPYGLILITGPTGSGKSTTLYSMLKLLNKEGANVVSLEDPVEYSIDGANQSQIHPEIGYDFATGLRHILRQDPDIIMVGEIRDKETAKMAIHAALTGHLVLSTLHTNNSIGVIPRLIDMGVDPFLIAPTLIMAVGQRLVRKLCDDSRKPIKLTGKTLEIVNNEIESMPANMKQEAKKLFSSGEIFQSEVSSTCPKGTRGRIGVFEILSMTPYLERLILSVPSEEKIAEEASRQGMITMRQDGILKVLRGIIGLEELLEVI